MSPPGRALVLSGDTAGASFEGPAMRLGSDPRCEVVLPQLAPIHAVIEPSGEHYRLRSQIGVWVDGAAALECELSSIAKLDFGGGIGAIFEQVGGSYRGKSEVVQAAAHPPDRAARGMGAVVPIGQLAKPRAGCAIAQLDDDRVLLAGGMPPMRGAPFADAEVFSLSGACGTLIPLTTARHGATATALPDGTILIAGGDTNTAELFDPRTQTTRPTGAMQAKRGHACAVPLANGLVMMLGGLFQPGPIVAEVYDPARGAFGGLRSPEFGYASAAPLDEHHHLIATTAGGIQRGPSQYFVFDRRTWRFEPLATPAPRWNVKVVPLGDGRAAVLGGSPARELGRRMDVFDLTTRAWSTASDMRALRGSPALVGVHGGIFAVGGDSLGTGIYSGEYYDPTTRAWRGLTPVWHGIATSGGFARADGSAVIVGVNAVSLAAA